MAGGALTRRQWLGIGALSAGTLALETILRRTQPVGRDLSGHTDVSAILSAPGFPVEGPRNGAIPMLVFSDYACGVCRRTEPRWRAAVAAAGDVRVIYRDWPILGEPSRLAARAALAAAFQGVHATFHHALIRTGRLDETGLNRALADAGGDWPRLQRDLVARADTIDRLLAQTARDAFQLGLSGTPAFLIGPLRIEGGASEGQFADAIARARTIARS